jgi:tRNA nucleotidyltransferase/poly(A) polymerase
MPILNYTTTVSAEKSASEIQKMLAARKAQAVLCEYDDEGILTHISFRLMTAHGPIFFRLPANVQGVHKALQQDERVDRHQYRTCEHAARVAWRICKDWIEAQLAIVDAEMADMMEIFLPYAQTETGETLYEVMKSKGFKQLTHGQGKAA